MSFVALQLKNVAVWLENLWTPRKLSSSLIAMSFRGRLVSDLSTTQKKALLTTVVAIASVASTFLHVQSPSRFDTTMAAHTVLTSLKARKINSLTKKGLRKLNLRTTKRRAKSTNFSSPFPDDDRHLFYRGTSDYDIATGLSESQFEEVCELVEKSLSKLPLAKQSLRPRILTLRSSVALVCVFLRSGLNYSQLANLYQLPHSTVARIVWWTVPHLRASLDMINFDMAFPGGYFAVKRVVGSIDCTSHPRDRVHPGQDTYYRGDKMMHFVTSQIICDHLGYIMRFTVAKGHNSDRRVYNLTKMDQFLEEKGWQLLADLGYSGSCLVTPERRKSANTNEEKKKKKKKNEEDALEENEENGEVEEMEKAEEQRKKEEEELELRRVEYNQMQASERAIVENVNAWFKNWKFCEVKCKIAPHLQAMCLCVAAQLYNMTHKPSQARIRSLLEHTSSEDRPMVIQRINSVVDRSNLATRSNKN